LSDPQDKPTLDRYLDGLLSAPDRERVERALAKDPAARAHVQAQKRIDASLGRLFHLPPGPVAIREPARRSWLRLVVWSGAAAAVLFIGLVGVWAAFLRPPAAGPSPLGPLYRTLVASGFTPKEVCTTRDDFARWVQQYYGQPIYPLEKHEGVEFLGWSYGQAVSTNSGVLLAKVNGTDVIVVVDRSVRDKTPFTSTGDPGLHLFRKQAGMVVLYEVTPLPQASIITILSANADGSDCR
jgi:hypothetical protein